MGPTTVRTGEKGAARCVTACDTVRCFGGAECLGRTRPRRRAGCSVRASHSLPAPRLPHQPLVRPRGGALRHLELVVTAGHNTHSATALKIRSQATAEDLEAAWQWP